MIEPSNGFARAKAAAEDTESDRVLKFVTVVQYVFPLILILIWAAINGQAPLWLSLGIFALPLVIYILLGLGV